MNDREERPPVIEYATIKTRPATAGEVFAGLAALLFGLVYGGVGIVMWSVVFSHPDSFILACTAMVCGVIMLGLAVSSIRYARRSFSGKRTIDMS